MEELLDKVQIARFMYSQGQTYISDAEYDAAMAELKGNGIVLSPIYEDDDIPYGAIERVLGITKSEVDSLVDKQEPSATNIELAADFLAESDSLSIVPVFTYDEAYAWFLAHRDLEIVISTKIDGINTRRGYEKVGNRLNYIASLTRGRKSDPLNVTDNMRKISPQSIESEIEQNLVIYSETIALKSAIAEINEKYNDNYTVPRGLAVSMMRVDKFSDDDYKNLKSYVFRVDYGRTWVEGVELARTLGFDVVPYVTYTYKGESFEVFKQQIEEIMQWLKTITDGMDVVTDGMVAEVNDREYYTLAGVNNNYSSANLAMKIGLWQPGVYRSKVVALDLEQQAERCACVAIVEPVVTNGGQKVSRVNCFNPSVLFAQNILPGKEITFEYKNETTVNLIMG